MSNWAWSRTLIVKAIDDKKLTIGPSSRPLAPSNCEPGRLIARTGTPIWQTEIQIQPEDRQRIL